MTITPFSLDVETDYQAWLSEQKIRYARVSSHWALILFLMFGLLDIWALPSSFFTVWCIRLTVLPLTLIILSFAKREAFLAKYYVPITAFQFLYYWGMITFMIYLSKQHEPARIIYYAGLLLVTVATYSWTFLPLRTVIWLEAMEALVYIMFAIVHQHMLLGEQIIFASNCFFMVSANVIGLITHRERDQIFRRNYLLQRSLQHADQMKTQFLSSMSHELRTPLNAIINFTQLIAIGTAGPVTEDQASMLDASLNSSRHLLQLINDVLDVTKIQAGKLVLYVEEDINLNQEIKTVLDIAEPLLQKQNQLLEQSVQLIKDIDYNLPRISCDRRRVRQILLNLLSNAIKFTENGTIKLSVQIQKNKILFSVTDTGPGVPAPLQAQIFEPFVQTLDGAKHSQGTGLGLPISQNLVRAHGGDLWMKSYPGEGSAFFFTLPIYAPVKPDANC